MAAAGVSGLNASEWGLFLETICTVSFCGVGRKCLTRYKVQSQHFPTLQVQWTYWHLRRQVADWCSVTSRFSHRQAAQESVQPALHQTHTNMHRHCVSRQSTCEGSVAIGSAFNLDIHCTWPRCLTAVCLSSLLPATTQHMLTFTVHTVHCMLSSRSL